MLDQCRGAALPGSPWAVSPAQDRTPAPAGGQFLTWHSYTCKLNNHEGGWISVSFLVSLFALFFSSLIQNTFQLLTNYQLLSTSLFQGEPGWAEEPQE